MWAGERIDCPNGLLPRGQQGFHPVVPAFSVLEGGAPAIPCILVGFFWLKALKTLPLVPETVASGSLDCRLVKSPSNLIPFIWFSNWYPGGLVILAVTTELEWITPMPSEREGQAFGPGWVILCC